MNYRKISADPRPFVVGKVRLAHPGWLNGAYTEYTPREEYGHTFEPTEGTNSENDPL